MGAVMVCTHRLPPEAFGPDFYTEYKKLVCAYYLNKISWVKFVEETLLLQE